MDGSNESLFEVHIKLTDEDGFTIEPITGKMSPAIADVLLALRVAQDTVMNEYYRGLANNMEQEFESSGGVEAVVTKVE